LRRPASKAAGRGRLDAVARLLVGEGAVLPECIDVVLLGAVQREAEERRRARSRGAVRRGKRA
jgi:hypothetical protein